MPQPAGSDSLNKEQGESSVFSTKEFAVFVATYVDTSLKLAAKLFRDDSIKMENPEVWLHGQPNNSWKSSQPAISLLLLSKQK